jgi:hypothetical protein
MNIADKCKKKGCTKTNQEIEFLNLLLYLTSLNEFYMI